MTKEQEEAILILKRIKMGIKADTQTPNVNVRNVARKKVKAIETVLSMLEEKDNKIAELEKSVEQIYEDYQDIGKIAFDDGEKIEILEKQIDLMAKYISEIDVSEDLCKEGVCNEDDDNCKECIKQYFENKVRQESDKGATGK